MRGGGIKGGAVAGADSGEHLAGLLVQLVFVEVRGRANHRYGGPAASITLGKQQRLLRTAAHYLQTHGADTACRFDVIAITGSVNKYQIDWIKNAFSS